MVRVEQSIEIARPIEDVFDFLTPFENLPRWEAGILEAGQTTTGPLGIGARGRDVRRFMGKPTETVYEVTGYARPTHFAVRSVAGPTPVEASYAFTATADGTRLLSRANLGIGGPMGLLAPLLSRAINRQHAKDLRQWGSISPPPGRRRGSGAMARRSPRAAGTAPDLPALLQASDLGRPVYERHGFRVVGRFDLRIFSRPA